ncbi:MAG: DUF4174 domain-containing protein [Rudanella sp.]|nr:DUF4174 domain-containing protein [Rudanella sp.]
MLMTVPQPPSLKRWLAENQWKHRIILLYAPSASSPELTSQRDILAADPSGLTERDLLVREVTADQLSDEDRAFLQQNLNTTGNTFRVLLIGKDGGVKVRKTSPIALKQLFGTIDGMYMRQQEMKNRGR